jgi:hypothetical protein
MKTSSGQNMIHMDILYFLSKYNTCYLIGATSVHNFAGAFAEQEHNNGNTSMAAR